MMLFPGAMAPTYLIPAPVAVFCPAPAPEKKEEKKEEKKPDPPKPDPPKPDPPKPDPPKPQCKPKCDHSHLLQHGPHIQINYGHCVHALSTCGSGCGGCSLVCCGPGPPCKAPRNTSTELMHWLDKKNAVHSVKKGELIPHYSKIAQVYTNKKWEVFTAASDMKAAQDACSCVQASKYARHSSENLESRQSTKFGGFFVAWGKNKKEKKTSKKYKQQSTCCEC